MHRLTSMKAIVVVAPRFASRPRPACGRTRKSAGRISRKSRARISTAADSFQSTMETAIGVWSPSRGLPQSGLRRP